MKTFSILTLFLALFTTNLFAQAFTVENINTDASCGLCNAKITLSSSGGTAPYTYAWANGGTTETVTGLCAPGTEGVTVTDAGGQFVSKLIFTYAAPDITIDESHTDVSGSLKGTVTLIVTGGIAPYTYSWSNGGTAANKDDLDAGTYTVTVTDNSGCTKSKQVVIGTSGGGSGVQDITGATPDFNLYPNPATSQLTVNFNTPVTAGGKISIMDILGRVLLTQDVPVYDKSLALGIDNLSPGLYIVSLHTANGDAQVKMRKE